MYCMVTAYRHIPTLHGIDCGIQ